MQTMACFMRMKLPGPVRFPSVSVSGRWGDDRYGRKTFTSLLDTGVIGWLHGGRDDGDEFPVDVFLLRVDGLAHRVGQVFEDLLVDA